MQLLMSHQIQFFFLQLLTSSGVATASKLARRLGNCFFTPPAVLPDATTAHQATTAHICATEQGRQRRICMQPLLNNTSKG